MSDTVDPMMADTSKQKKTRGPEAKLAQSVGHVLWMVQSGDTVEKNSEARKLAWKQAKPEMMKSARILIRRLAKKGIVITQTDVPPSADDAEAGEE